MASELERFLRTRELWTKHAAEFVERNGLETLADFACSFRSEQALREGAAPH